MAQKKKKSANVKPAPARKTDKIWTMLPAIATGALLVLFVLSTLGDGLWLTLIGIRTPVVVAILTAIVWVFVDELRKGLKGIKNEDLSKRQKILDWIKLALIAVCVLCFVLTKTNSGKSIADYDGEPPFATMRDFANGEVTDYRQTVRGKRLNYCKEWSDIVAPRNVEWSEQAAVTTAEGEFDGSLTVYYHEAANVGIAEGIVREYYRKDSHRPDFELYDGAEGVAADYISLYTTDGLYDTALIRKGNVVVRADVFRAADSVSVEEAARLLADSIG